MSSHRYHGPLFIELPATRDLREPEKRFAHERNDQRGRIKRWWHRWSARGKTRPVVGEDVQ